MLGDIRQDCRQCPDAKGGVIRNGKMMLAVLGGGEPQVASRLASDAVAAARAGCPRHRAGVSYCEYLFTDVVQTHDSRCLPFFEMAPHSITDVFVQLLHGLCLREDGLPERAGGVTTLWRFLYKKDDLVHIHALLIVTIFCKNVRNNRLDCKTLHRLPMFLIHQRHTPSATAAAEGGRQPLDASGDGHLCRRSGRRLLGDEDALLHFDIGAAKIVLNDFDSRGAGKRMHRSMEN
jgi:hypothetical protein